MREVTQALLSLLDSGRQGALATVISSTGSTPQRPGARILLLEDGTKVGTVGGGAIEQAVLEALMQCLRDGRPKVFRRDLVRDLGMCCGGRMELFVEKIEGHPRLILFGAGHVALAVSRLAPSLGFELTIVDDRPELNTAERFPAATRILAEPEEALTELSPEAGDFLLVLTHDHRLDEQAIATYLPLPHRYLGAIGSRRKVYRILARIAARRPLPALDTLYAPVGVSLGAISPEEIAISIAAELVALRRGQEAAHLRIIDDPLLAKVLSAEVTPALAADSKETASE